jgi:glycosyltransferase involved in cell wall biosynthesis
VATARGADASPPPSVTVAFLLYNAAEEVPSLLASLARQVHPALRRQADWQEAVIVDDASSDGTADAVRSALAGRGSAALPLVAIAQPRARLQLNEVMAQARTPSC